MPLIFYHLNMICLRAGTLEFNLLVILWVSLWMVSIINFLKFLVSFPQIFLLLSFVFLLFLELQLYILQSFWFVPQFFDVPLCVLFVFFSPYFHLGSLYHHFFKLTGSFLGRFQYTDKPMKGILHFCLCFWLLAFPFDIYWRFCLCIYIIHMFFYVVHMSCMLRAITTLNILMLLLLLSHLSRVRLCATP